MFKINLVNLRNSFPFRKINVMGDDVFSFEHLEDKDNYDLSSVVDHADIMRVYTESSYLN